eukprot:363280-Chlamydomonas_euryale.AAC.13
MTENAYDAHAHLHAHAHAHATAKKPWCHAKPACLHTSMFLKSDLGLVRSSSEDIKLWTAMWRLCASQCVLTRRSFKAYQPWLIAQAMYMIALYLLVFVTALAAAPIDSTAVCVLAVVVVIALLLLLLLLC